MNLALTVSPGAATLVYRLPSIIVPIDLASLLPARRPLEVELGSGDGSFLVDRARLHPERDFIGVERLLGRLRKTDRKGLRAGLNNLRLIRLEAGYFIEFLVPAASVRTLHVYFPDPWPKRKHRRHRLINERFPALASRILEPDGMVCLRTDDADYFAQMNAVFTAAAGEFTEVETPTEIQGTRTDFERDFQARGTPTLRVAYRRVS